MNVTQEQKNDALKIVYIYSVMQKELGAIEKELAGLNERKDTLLIDLETTRAAEAELIDKIKASNPGQQFDITQLFKTQDN